LHRLVTRGLGGTADLFAPVKELFEWVYRVAHELSNHDALSGPGVRRRWDGLIREMGHRARRRPDLSEPLAHFVKVSRSYEPGLFHCYDVPDLPRTNNDLEHLFGSHRYHERRASGRKGSVAGTGGDGGSAGGGGASDPTATRGGSSVAPGLHAPVATITG
jgi:uncharacterized membrane protein YgcG